MTFRSLLVGLLAVTITVIIVSYAELVTGRIMIGFLQLPPVVVALLFLFVLLNKILGRLRARWPLTPQELAVVHVMMVLASMITSRGLMEDLIPTLVGVNYYANPTNEWQRIFFKHIPPWAVPWDPKGPSGQEVTRHFYEGLAKGDSVPWHPWVGPLLFWGGLVGLVYGVFLFLSTIIYRQWSEHEKLGFPLVQLPLEMVRGESGRSFWRSPLMWTGFALTVVVFGINGLHAIQPGVPEIKVEYVLHVFFVNRPWNAIGILGLWIWFSLAAVGFFYLLPSQILFSLWFFYILGKLNFVANDALGLSGKVWNCLYPETLGAYFVLVGFWVWAARHHLRAVARSATRRLKLDDRKEVVPYPVAFWGFVLCLLGLLVWNTRTGMAFLLGVLMYGAYLFVQSIVMARCMAEAGLLMTEGSWRALDVWRLFLPARRLGIGNLTSLCFFDAFFSRDLRGLVLTGFLDGQRMADGVKLPRRQLLLPFVLALVAAFVFATVVHLYLPYHRGAITLYSYVYRGNNIQFFSEYGSFMQLGEQFNRSSLGYALFGALFTLFLTVMRTQFPWWPLHPLGFAMSASWTTTVFWFPIFIAWVIKWPMQRYGGYSLITKARPFFLGLIFGEFTMAVFWTLISMIYGTPTPFFPWP